MCYGRDTTSQPVAVAAQAAAPRLFVQDATGHVYTYSSAGETRVLNGRGYSQAATANLATLMGSDFREIDTGSLADRKKAAESGTGFKLDETVATFDGIKVVVGFGRVNLPENIGIDGIKPEPARVLLLADLTDLEMHGVEAVAPYSPNNVHKLADHPDNATL